LAASERCLALIKGHLTAEASRAHALMFLGRSEEAKALYLQYKGKRFFSGKLWEWVIAEDFAAFRKAGLIHPMMAEFETALGVANKLP
jgi:hypothetical protein